MSTDLADLQNIHFHRYGGLNNDLLVSGYVIALHEKGVEHPRNIVGPWRQESDAILFMLALAQQSPDHEFHLWPLVATEGLKEPNHGN